MVWAQFEVVYDVLQIKPMRKLCVWHWQSQNANILKNQFPHCHSWHMQRQKYDPSCVYTFHACLWQKYDASCVCILHACLLQLFALVWGVDADMLGAYYGLRQSPCNLAAPNSIFNVTMVFLLVSVSCDSPIKEGCLTCKLDHWHCDCNRLLIYFPWELVAQSQVKHSQTWSLHGLVTKILSFAPVPWFFQSDSVQALQNVYIVSAC